MSAQTFPRILIVDDNIDNLNLLSDILTSKRYKVRRAINGALALKSIAFSPPTLILLDINLPDITGYEICRQLKKNPATNSIPVIFISALDETLDKLKAFAAGGVDYISKPFDIAEVLVRVENQLALQFARAELQVLNEALEQRVVERTVQLEQVNQQLTLSNQSLKQEIADRKLAQEQLRLFDSIVIETSDAVVITNVKPQDEEDAGLPIIYVNRAFTDRTGYSFEEVVGKTPRILQGAKTNPATKSKIREAIKTYQPIRAEILNYTKEGKEFWADLNIFPVADDQGQYTHWVSIQRDTTLRKKQEEETIIALEKERELNELRSRFVSTTSHEFRTPLATILSSVDLLEHYGHLSTKTENQEYFRQIRTAIKRMTELMDDVLTLDKTDAGKLNLNLKTIDLNSFFSGLVSEIHANKQNKSTVKFNLNCSEEKINIDEKILRQIFSNLLSNALKYSPINSEVELEVSCFKEKIIVKIQDQGIGIPLEEQASLFEPFFRAKNVGTIPGTGLGLSIVGRLVELYGGRIELESKLNIGTKFIVTLPRHKPSGNSINDP